MENTHSNQKQAYFEPPPGGDVTLCSTDGVVFCVHSVVLSLASSVFRDMLAVGTAGIGQAINLSEDGQTLSLMLDFIYPIHKSPTITELALLRSCLEVARKYDLNAMLEDIDTQLSQPTSKIFSGPLDLYTTSLEYSLPNSKVGAARRLLGGDYDLLKPTSFSKLSISYPSSKNMMALAVVQGARYRILTEVLLDFNAPHLHNSTVFSISCDGCQGGIDSEDEDIPFSSPPPGWLLQWTAATHKALAAAPLEQCLQFFNAGIFDTFYTGSAVACASCLDCFWGVVEHRETFNSWARGVKDLLEDRLTVLEPLYRIC
ncbi:hypothetical protein FRC09_002981 [Ceratobasidium sp. 395]|nr:hypothetical protein FRC09_002981 [Ceratobasidium sp. 395]